MVFDVEEKDLLINRIRDFISDVKEEIKPSADSDNEGEVSGEKEEMVEY